MGFSGRHHTEKAKRKMSLATKEAMNRPGVRMKWENTLMAFEEDIKNRDFWDWMKAHTSGYKPLHRYEGTLELDEEKIVFDGKDAKEDKNFHLEISNKDIEDVYLGWDEVFTGFPVTRAGDRAYPWNMPLRMKHKSGQLERTLYLFARFHHTRWIRASDNKEVYEEIKSILERDKKP